MVPDEILKHVSAGDPIRAPAWNEIVDIVRREVLTDECMSDSNGVRRRRFTLPGYAQIWIINTSYNNCRAGEVLSPYEEYYDPTKEAEIYHYVGMPTMKGRTPTAEDTGNFCVLTEDCPAGGKARAVISGPCAVKVKQLTSGADRYLFADVITDEWTHLEEKSSGYARVLGYTESMGSEEKWALVNLGQSEPLIRYKLTADLYKHSSAVIDIYTINNDGTKCDCGTGTLYDASDEDDPSGLFLPTDTIGVAKWWIDSYRFEPLTWIKPAHPNLKALANITSTTTGPTTIAVDNVVTLDRSGAPDVDVFTLEFNWRIKNDAVLYAEWNGTVYVIYASDCP